MIDYLTEEEAVAYIGQNAMRDRSEVTDHVTAVSRFIDDYCGRHFYQDGTIAVPVARTFVPSHETELRLGVFNDLVSVSAVAVDTAGNRSFSTALTGYALEPFNPKPGYPYTTLRLYGTTFTSPGSNTRPDIVRVTGVWGWPAVPAPVKSAAKILMAELNKLADAPLGITGQSDFGIAYVGRRLPARVTDLLAPYRHPDNFGIA